MEPGIGTLPLFMAELTFHRADGPHPVYSFISRRTSGGFHFWGMGKSLTWFSGTRKETGSAHTASWSALPPHRKTQAPRPVFLARFPCGQASAEDWTGTISSHHMAHTSGGLASPLLIHTLQAKLRRRPLPSRDRPRIPSPTSQEGDTGPVPCQLLQPDPDLACVPAGTHSTRTRTLCTEGPEASLAKVPRSACLLRPSPTGPQATYSSIRPQGQKPTRAHSGKACQNILMFSLIPQRESRAAEAKWR